VPAMNRWAIFNRPQGGLSYLAFSSTWKRPNVLPSVSTKYPCQQTPGTANFGSTTFPSRLPIFSAVSSKFSTSIETTNAFVPHSGGDGGAGRLSDPPLEPPVSMRQYSTGSPKTCSNFQPKISL